MQKNTRKVTEFDRSILRRHPYRGILKQISDELGVTRVVITRRIDANDAQIMEMVLQKMVLVNRREEEQLRQWTSLKARVVLVANGATNVVAARKANRKGIPK